MICWWIICSVIFVLQSWHCIAAKDRVLLSITFHSSSFNNSFETFKVLQICIVHIDISGLHPRIFDRNVLHGRTAQGWQFDSVWINLCWCFQGLFFFFPCNAETSKKSSWANCRAGRKSTHHWLLQYIIQIGHSLWTLRKQGDIQCPTGFVFCNHNCTICTSKSLAGKIQWKLF